MVEVVIEKFFLQLEGRSVGEVRSLILLHWKYYLKRGRRLESNNICDKIKKAPRIFYRIFL